MKTLSQLNEEERKALYFDVVRLWGKVRTKKIAEKHGVKYHSIPVIASTLRKKGIPLPKLTASAWLTPDMLDELQKEFANR